MDVVDKPIVDRHTSAMSLAERIAHRMSELELPSAAALAAHLGVNPSTASRWLAGGGVGDESVATVASFLDVDVDEVLLLSQAARMERRAGQTRRITGQAALDRLARVPGVRVRRQDVEERLAEVERRVALLEALLTGTVGSDDPEALSLVEIVLENAKRKARQGAQEGKQDDGD